jgi:hypothetical protein
MRPASVDIWSTAIAAALGGVLGILATTAYHLLHDHSWLPPAALLPHFLPQLVAGCAGGALVIGWAALAYDRKRRLSAQSRGNGDQLVH